MTGMTGDEVRSWLDERALIDGEGKFATRTGAATFRIASPPDPGRRVHLSRTLTHFLRADHGGLIWIDEYGMWPSSENRSIFRSVRMSFGERRPLEMAPGQLFGAGDEDYIEALLALILLFSWGAIAVQSTRRLVLRISHDEYVDIYTSDGPTLEQLRDTLRAAKFRE